MPISAGARRLERIRVSPTPYYADDAVTIWHGDAADLSMIPDASVDLVCTSPPYWSLRSYQDGGAHYEGQIGSEEDSDAYIDRLLQVHTECSRVMKPGGSQFWNLGDKYGSDKSLLMLPQRFADAVRRGQGGAARIVRAEVIWSKPNSLPESVTDRVRRSHETWWHFTQQGKYFTAADEIREPHQSTDWIGRTQQERVNGDRRDQGKACNTADPLGKLPGSVWEIPTQPLKVPPHLGVDHFAAFPMEWPRRIIKGWSPTAICIECGEGRRPVIEAQRHRNGIPVMGALYGSAGKFATATGRGHIERTARTMLGYVCACDAPDAPTRAAVILDPFGGTGTTALVARTLGRRAHHVDLSADYCRLAQWRVTDPGELARAMQVEKPPAAPEDMDSLLDLIDEGAA